MRKEMMKVKAKKVKRYTDKALSKLIIILDVLVKKYNELEERLIQIQEQLDALAAERKDSE
jgi:hypothetical protein